MALNLDSSLNPVHALKRQLLAIGFEHDSVLDLHCDKTAIMHVYSSWDYQERAAALARCMGAPVLILEDEAGGGQHVTHGSIIAEIVACDSGIPGRRTPVKANASGTLIAHAHIPLVTPGQRIAMIGGNAVLPDRQSGKLLHD